jgi:hypothetical protein
LAGRAQLVPANGYYVRLRWLLAGVAAAAVTCSKT